MSEYITVARPYAKAAFDFAVEQNQLDQWQGMLNFAAAVAENDQIKNFLKLLLQMNLLMDYYLNIKKIMS